MEPLDKPKKLNDPESVCCSGFFLFLVIALALPPLLFLQTLKQPETEGIEKAIQERAGQRIMTAARWEQQRHGVLNEKRQNLVSEIQMLEASRSGIIQEAMGSAILRSSQKLQEEKSRLIQEVGSSASEIQRLKQNEPQRRQEHMGMAVLAAYKRGARDLPAFQDAFQKEFTRLTLVDQRRLNRLENNLRNLIAYVGEYSGQFPLIINEAARTAQRTESIFLESDRSRIRNAISGLDKDLSVYITPDDYQYLAGFVPEILSGRKGVSEFMNYGFFALLGLGVVWIWLASLASQENPPLDFSETRAIEKFEHQETHGVPTAKAA